jgi:hypothetical protein
MAHRLTYGKRFAPSGLGLRKNAVGLTPFVHFCGCWNCFAIPSSQPQKRRLPVHVRRKIFELVGEKCIKNNTIIGYKIFLKMIKNVSFIF